MPPSKPPDGKPWLAVLVFPVPLLAFAYPFDRRLDALVARLRPLGVGNPLHVFLFATRTEIRENRSSLLVSLQRLRELRRRLRRRYGRLHHLLSRGNRARVFALVDKRYSLLQHAEHFLLRGKISHAGQPTQGPHCARLQKIHLAQDGGNLFAPESPTAVLIERRHVADDRALVFEERPAPFHCLHDSGASLVHQFTNFKKNRLREGFRLRNISIDAFIERGSWAHSFTPARFAKQCNLSDQAQSW